METYNSAFLLSPEKEIAGRYDKLHLVPFGEYIPYLFSFTGRIIRWQTNMHHGRKLSLLPFPPARIGVLICYEDIYPALTRRIVTEGAEVLVNMTNLAWFGKSSAIKQHLIMTVFRAIENRRYVLTAGNTGVTAFIDPVGKIISSVSPHTQSSLVDEARALRIKTFYSEYGDMFSYACIGCVLLIGLCGYWKEKSR